MDQILHDLDKGFSNGRTKAESKECVHNDRISIQFLDICDSVHEFKTHELTLLGEILIQRSSSSTGIVNHRLVAHQGQMASADESWKEK